MALSCTGEGFGHASRTVAIAHVLMARYRIVIFCPPHLFGFMREHLGAIALEPIPYFSFVKRRERIDYPRTVWANLARAARFPLDIARIADRLRHHGVQALISDYDPYGAYAADHIGVPILQINHPSVVLRDRDCSLEALLARLISVILMGKYHRKLIVSFYDGDIGPVVRPELTRSPIRTEDFFVVYLKPTYRKLMLRALRRLRIHNVEIFPDPNKNIVDYLSRCKGVISSAGHQFMSEAMVLRKPVFVVPQVGQYEQLLNARKLEESGWGTWATVENLDERLGEFVRCIDQYPRAVTNGATRYRFANDIDRAVIRIEHFLHAHRPRPKRVRSTVRRPLSIPAFPQ